MIDIIYCRVSTDDQTSNTSLPDQESKCRDYLGRLGFDNVMIFREDYSGFEFNRPELSKVLTLMRQGKVRSFTALRVDRICRSSGVLEQLREGYFKPLGIKVHTLDLMEWSWSAAHESIQDSLCIMGSFWGKILKEVLQAGRKKHIANGNVITAGHAPFGLKEVVEFDARGKRTGSHIDFDEFEGSIVLMIFNYYVNDNLSLSKIADRLNDAKIPTYTQLRGLTSFKRYQEDSKSGHKWRSGTIRQILRETAYDGRWYFGKTKTVKDSSGQKRKVRTEENLILVEIPAFLPHDLWQAAQFKLDQNREEKRGKTAKYEYLLSKRISCECGYKMTCSAKSGGKYLYYRCPTVNKELDNPDCKTGYVDAKLVDAIAWAWLYRLLSDKDELKNKLQNYVAEKEKLSEPIIARLAILDKSLTKKHSEHETMISHFMKLPELAQAKVLASIKQTEETIEELENEAVKLRASLEDYKKDLSIIREYIDPNSPLNSDGERLAVLSLAMYMDEFDEIDQLKNNNDTLTFEDKLKYVTDFDLQATILNGGENIRLTCKVGNEILSLLDATALSNTQKEQFYISFADVLKLDFSTLAGLRRIEV